MVEILGFTAGALVLAWCATYVLQSIYDRVYERWRGFRWDRLTYLAQKHQVELDKIRVLQPDERGQLGVVFDGKVYRSLDTYAVFEQSANRYFDPLMEQLRQQHKLLLAIADLGTAGPKALDAAAVEALPPSWPDVVRLGDVFADRRPSVDDLVIGVHPTESGLDVVSLSLHELMHTLTVGASGWGKSSWLRALLWQVARASEPIEVVALDVNGSEFNVLRDWGKLRYPVARTAGDAVATLGAVSEEIGRRRDLYEHNAPVASKLTEYNAATGADLPPWLVVIDEGTALLNDAALGNPIRDAVQSARQYGVYVLLAGQSAHHRVIPTQVRDNFSSRLCFRTSPTSSRVVLDESVANGLTVKGRFWAQLTGKDLAELQGPFLSREEFMAALSNGGPRNPTPEMDAAMELAAGELGLSVEQIERIIDLWTEGRSYSAVADEVFAGGRNARRVEAVRKVIEEMDLEA